jgi:hypothetical protein
MIGKAPRPNGLQNRALKHLPQRAISLLVTLLNAALVAQYFPPLWKYARVISTLKPGKDPSLSSSYGPINLQTIEKIILSRNLSEVSGCGLLRFEQFGFRPKQNTTLQLKPSIPFGSMVSLLN